MVRMEKMVHKVCLGLLETPDQLEIQDFQVSKVLLASLESKVLAVQMEVWVSEAFKAFKDWPDSLERLAHLEMWDFKAS